MRVGLLAPRSRLEDGGGHTFEEDLFLSFLKLHKDTRHQLIVFADDERWRTRLSEYDIEVVISRYVRLRRTAGAFRKLINSFFTNVLGLPNPIRTEEWMDPILFKHGIAFFVNLTPSTVTREVPYLTQIWDLQHRVQPYFPEVSVKGRWSRWEAKFAALASRASFVVVPNEKSKRELQLFYGLVEDRIRVLPEPTPSFALAAGNEPKRPLPKHLGIGEGYLLYPAQFWPHKNHSTILRALTVLRDKYSCRPSAVFVGADWGNLDYVRRLTVELGLSDQVHFLGLVSREDLIALYQNAEALVYASMFGPENLPPLEAFALRCPVIAAKISSADQLGDAALIVDETDERAYADAFYRLHQDPALRAELISKGLQRAVKFTGDDFAREVFRILDEFENIRATWSSYSRHDPQFRVRHLFGG
jgi:glycosyltransferase involved in cell wall biosynthesis